MSLESTVHRRWQERFIGGFGTLRLFVAFCHEKVPFLGEFGQKRVFSGAEMVRTYDDTGCFGLFLGGFGLFLGILGAEISEFLGSLHWRKILFFGKMGKVLGCPLDVVCQILYL